MSPHPLIHPQQRLFPGRARGVVGEGGAGAGEPGGPGHNRVEVGVARSQAGDGELVEIEEDNVQEQVNCSI